MLLHTVVARLRPCVCPQGFSDLGSGHPGTVSSAFTSATFEVWIQEFRARMEQHLAAAALSIGKQRQGMSISAYPSPCNGGVLDMHCGVPCLYCRVCMWQVRGTQAGCLLRQAPVPGAGECGQVSGAEGMPVHTGQN